VSSPSPIILGWKKKVSEVGFRIVEERRFSAASAGF
jgi:hypothetical protein